jgi:hypothetical protein
MGFLLFGVGAGKESADPVLSIIHVLNVLSSSLYMTLIQGKTKLKDMHFNACTTEQKELNLKHNSMC